MAGPGGNLQLPAWKLKSPTTGDFLKGGARAHYDLAKQSPCPVPVEGGTMDAPVKLEARAWYETFVRVTHPTAPKVDLAGVTFRTSRWTDTTDMLSGLHFPVKGSAQASGDVALAKPVSAVAAGASDTAFDAALLALGLEGWPVPAEPRASLLWALMSDQKSWGVAGLLLESPEPIERPGRTGPAAFSPRLAPDQAAVTFATKVSDRTGSRLLWLTSSPFVPAAWFTRPSRPPLPGPGKPPIPGPGPIILKRFPQLVLTMPDITMDRPKGVPVPTLSGFLSLPIAPLFAGEAY